MRERFRVVGGARLVGEVSVVGAKNSALKLMAVALLAEGRTTLTNMPEIADVRIMAELLRRLGVSVDYDPEAGVAVIDVPAAAAEPCARAFARYRERRRVESGKEVSPLPLPDFFIGAHAEIMGWTLATADEGRFRTYFPSVKLKAP